jgi:hypothetical protein
MSYLRLGVCASDILESRKALPWTSVDIRGQKMKIRWIGGLGADGATKPNQTEPNETK